MEERTTHTCSNGHTYAWSEEHDETLERICPECGVNDDEAEFTIRVKVKRTPSNVVETNDWSDGEDLVDFLNERFTVGRDDRCGLDAYNKHAGQLVLSFDVE